MVKRWHENVWAISTIKKNGFICLCNSSTFQILWRLHQWFVVGFAQFYYYDKDLKFPLHTYEITVYKLLIMKKMRQIVKQKVWHSFRAPIEVSFLRLACIKFKMIMIRWEQIYLKAPIIFSNVLWKWLTQNTKKDRTKRRQI